MSDDAMAGSAAGDEPALVLDCRGMRCPLPIIELAKRIGEVDPGAVVAVIADDPAAAADVPAWCRMRGQEYLGAAAGPGGAPAYTVRRLG
ncbi:MAG TPA: sulfurtransferase TusA family protein [Jiangellaceae bacterium]